MTIRSAPRDGCVAAFGNFFVGRPTGAAKDSHVRNCKLCGLSKFCNDLPGFCIFLQMVAVVTMVGVLAYLFVTQEMLG